MLTLYYAPGSSSFATHIALNEVGASFDGITTRSAGPAVIRTIEVETTA